MEFKKYNCDYKESAFIRDLIYSLSPSPKRGYTLDPATMFNIYENELKKEIGLIFIDKYSISSTLMNFDFFILDEKKFLLFRLKHGI